MLSSWRVFRKTESSEKEAGKPANPACSTTSPHDRIATTSRKDVLPLHSPKQWYVASRTPFQISSREILGTWTSLSSSTVARTRMSCKTWAVCNVFLTCFCLWISDHLSIFNVSMYQHLLWSLLLFGISCQKTGLAAPFHQWLQRSPQRAAGGSLMISDLCIQTSEIQDA